MGYFGNGGVEQLRQLSARKSSRANTIKEHRSMKSSMLTKGMVLKKRSHPKASPDVLAKIASDSKEERRRLMTKRLILVAVLLVPAMLGAVYALKFLFYLNQLR